MSDISEAFCTFFSQIGPDLAGRVRGTHRSFRDYLGPASSGSLFMNPTTPGEVEKICLGLDSSKGPGHDGFSPEVVKFCAMEISLPLSKLINACLGAGYFPNFLKIASFPYFQER